MVMYHIAVVELPLSSPSLDMETLLLAVYFLVVLYVLYQMALSLEDKLEDKVDILVDENTLGGQTQDQLSQQPHAKHITARVRSISFGKEKKVKRPVLALIFDADKEVLIPPEILLAQKALGMNQEAIQELAHHKILIRISPTNEQKLNPIPYVSVAVTNSTDDTQVYVDWDRSSLEMFGQGNRVIRYTPTLPVDLSQSQVPTVINPGMTVSANITTEQKYNRDPETKLVRPPLPIVELKERVEMVRLTDPNAGEENIQNLYTLDLMVVMKHRIKPDNSELISLLIPFIFKMKIKVDQPAFPPARWLLRHFGKRRPPSQGNWFWGSSRLEGSRLEDRK
jgi:hypothetical protein